MHPLLLKKKKNDRTKKKLEKKKESVLYKSSFCNENRNHSKKKKIIHLMYLITNCIFLLFTDVHRRISPPNSYAELSLLDFYAKISFGRHKELFILFFCSASLMIPTFFNVFFFFLSKKPSIQNEAQSFLNQWSYIANKNDNCLSPE